MKKIRNNKGITLIALVVTIIVLIILAGVSINLVLGDNGILTKAKEAKEESNEAQVKEKMQLAVQEYVINRNTGDSTSLQDILRANLDESKIEDVTENGKAAVVTYDGERIKIDLDKGTIGQDSPFDVWDGQSASTGLVGKGTKEEPYLIYSASDLYYMSQCVGQGYEATVVGLNENKTENGCNAVACKANYKLMTNIALNDVSEYDNWNNGSFDKTTLNSWTPIGRNDVTEGSGVTFSGVFDGNGYEVTGLYIENSQARTIGLFGYVAQVRGVVPTIKNVSVTNVYMYGYGYAGAIVGSSTSGANIENCYSSGYIEIDEGADGWGGSIVGGIIGELYGGRIVNCVSETVVKGDSYVGGIVGKICKSYNDTAKEYMDITVENCHNTADIYGNQDVGGVVGSSSVGTTGNLGLVKNCYNTGNIRSFGNRSNHIGGVIGRVENVKVVNCYNTGNITDIVEANANNIGGIAGIVDLWKDTEIIDCYNTGNIEGNVKRVGGIVGLVTSGSSAEKVTIQNCRNTGIITSTDSSKGDIVGSQYYEGTAIIK